MQRFLKKISLPHLNVSEHAIMIFMAIIVGVLGGYGAIVFRLFVRFSQSIFFGPGGTSFLDHVMALPWYAKLIHLPQAACSSVSLSIFRA